MKYKRTTDKQERPRFLRLFQRVLDANPPPATELRIRLMMGTALVIGFTPFMDAEAIPFYVEGIEKMEDGEDTGKRETLMVLRTHLTDLLARNYGQKYLSYIDELFRDNIELPEDKIVLDMGKNERYNLEQIAKAQMPGQGQRMLREMFAKTGDPKLLDRIEINEAEFRRGLLAERQRIINDDRKDMVVSYGYKLHVRGAPGATLIRLQNLQAERPNDAAFQEGVAYLLDRLQKSIQASPRSTLGDGDVIKGFGEH
ncbi:MAG: hypothetical protein NT031_12865 [Planctomycetota bacterium]|nr:hypothetical protein [Planctomycetota bacterium]